MSESIHVIVFDDLSPILNDFTQEDKEKLRSIFDGVKRVGLWSITAIWKCPLCFANDRTIACLCSQDEIEEYKKKPHYCPRCERKTGNKISMALMGSSK
jgi:hypothetical protein